MKNIHLFTAAIGAAMLIAAPVFAGPWDVKPATAGVSTTNPYVGTSLSDTHKRVYLADPNSAFPDGDRDLTGYIVGTAGPEKGRGDEYGSVLFDVGAQRE